MSQIHVCSLSQIPQTVRSSGARTLVTLINDGTAVMRPAQIEESRHLFVAMSDILLAAEGHILPAEEHVATLLEFVRAWDRAAPIVIHCFAGVSRSTAAAFITACALCEDRSELDIAKDLRARSGTATPNRLLVEIADRMLEREGRMVAAIDAIGRGEECYEGIPFSIDLAGVRA